MMKANIATLGCKVNQVESSSIVLQLETHGYEIVGFDQPADVYIINTCTVTNRTDFKSRNLIRKALKEKQSNPQVKIIVTGCYAQKEKDEISALGEIDLIVDNQSKVNLDDWLENSDYCFRDIDTAEEFTWIPIEKMHEKTRAFLKIQDGCNYYCSYCAVPYGRGKPRSLDFNKVISQAKILVENGYREIVLSGVNLGLYHDKAFGKNLADVIKAMDKISNLNLLRISSLEPDLWIDEILQAIADSDKVCPHFHIPMQSGADKTLTRMKRHYTKENVIELVNCLTSIRQGCAIGLDVICGFPGETEGDFQESADLIARIPVAYLHVFGYSKRSRTPAAEMTGQVKGDTIRQRVNELSLLSNIKKTEYMNQLIARNVKLSGIAEKKTKGISMSLSDHYVRIYTDSYQVQISSLMSGKAIETYKDGILIQLS
jgi:threonylcarbamoyladenosine tRNA methylthiotransferase MtaB